MNIQVFNEINDSHAATGYEGRTDLPAFHVYTIEDTYPQTRKVMPPYRFGFYQIVLLENSGDARLNMNAEEIADLSDNLAFASSQHILAWVRGEAQRGFILYFKAEFLPPYLGEVQDEFPFFRLTELNLLKVTGQDKPILCSHFQQLLKTFQSNHPYRVQILQALLVVLLFECKRLYDLQEQTIRQASPKITLAYRFQQFVNQHFLTRKTVEAYAELLTVSPNYLSQTIKVTMGKTARRVIAERILLEAKNLLAYTNLSIAEIADYLGYTEPTHFTRFFRTSLGLSPLAWRQQQQ
jgi:AraC-like DNA-binding protein